MGTNNNFNIGKRIRELRNQKGFSQEQLALSANITTTYLGMLERNTKNPTVKIIERICSSLNVSLQDFFSDAVPAEAADTLSEQILGQLNNRTDEEKQIILQITKNILKLRDLADKPDL